MTPRGPIFAFAASMVAATFGVACSAVPTPTGLEQPIRVRDAQFIEGAFPGRAAPSAAGGAAAAPAEPFVATAEATNRNITAGQAEKEIAGKASLGTSAIGVALKGAGSGYWLALSGGVDYLANLVEWRVSIDFSSSAPTGLHELLFAAIDANVGSGTQMPLPICIVPAIPDWIDNPLQHNACNPKFRPPATVVSLDWDTPVDLDLRVVTPDGKVVDSKNPTTATAGPDGGVATISPRTGMFVTDSNARCIPSGGNRENVVWNEQPLPGTHAVYANLFDACGEAVVHFNVSLHVAAAGDEPDTFEVVETFRTSGSLAEADANGGARIGLFVTEFQVE